MPFGIVKEFGNDAFKGDDKCVNCYVHIPEDKPMQWKRDYYNGPAYHQLVGITYFAEAKIEYLDGY